MAGLEGNEQPRGHGRAAAARWSPAVADEQALKALELFGDPTEAEVPLPSRPESAASARRLAQVVVLNTWRLSPRLAEDAVLLVSELVGNAVRHTGARLFGLRMRRRPGWIRVEIRDPSRALPCLMPVQETDLSGRGLFLVDKLSDRWGVDLLPRGKTTWFEMRVADRLAVAGHRVVVYERTETYGGAVRRFERDGFGFDTGPGLLTLPAVYRDLFVKTGKAPLEERVELVQVDPSSRHVFADGSGVALPNATRAGVVAALDEALGAGTGERWGDFLVRSREAWDRTRRPLLEEPLWPNWRVLAEKEPYPAVPHKRLLRTRRATTLAEVGAWELRDERLAALLAGHALAHGLDPRTAPASAAVLPYMEHAFGTWYVRGGIRELARAVYERCLERRVEFVFGAEITRIVEKDGRAAGVEPAGGPVAEADHVVADVHPTRLRALTEHPLDGEEDVRADPGAVTPARFTVLLALRGAPEPGAAHRTVVHPADPEREWDFLASPGGA
ncbi:FAD-dependent oxidoreductase, partial [Streptomyces sp. WELS2]|uniref:FAD-dependent oxidoreductase n=1 Tax=Streptomyces sp. WELS2 TaxID=2749435 RepID=UPI0015F03D1A